MKYLKSCFFLAVISSLVMISCEKKVTPIDETYTVNINYNATSKNAVNSDVTLNPKDTIVLNFTITAESDMSVIEIQKNGGKIDTFKVSDANRRSFSGTKTYIVDSVNGSYTYRIFARNKAGVYMGDGNKRITITVNPDFYNWTYRFLYVPDSTAKTNKCFLAASTGKTYSYSDGMASSGSIDFGYFYDTTKVLIGTPAVLTERGHSIFALNANLFTPYDLSSWTKNATPMKLSTTVAFANITSAGAIRAACVSALSSGTVNRIATTDRPTASQSTLLTGAVILFRTVAGKYGVLSVNFTNSSRANPDSYINIDVKIEK